MSEIAKVTRDGKVAVLLSPGYGAGWYSWNSGNRAMLFDPDIVAAVEAGEPSKADQIAESKWPGGSYLSGGDLCIEWLPVGTVFDIEEYDGAETIRIIGGLDDFVTA